MENPATWGDAEKVIENTMENHERLMREQPGLCGLSLTRKIAAALRAAGLLGDISMPLAAAALADLDRVQAEVYHNWSRGGDEAELEELRKVAEALRRDLGRMRDERQQGPAD